MVVPITLDLFILGWVCWYAGNRFARATVLPKADSWNMELGLGKVLGTLQVVV